MIIAKAYDNIKKNSLMIFASLILIPILASCTSYDYGSPYYGSSYDYDNYQSGWYGSSNCSSRHSRCYGHYNRHNNRNDGRYPNFNHMMPPPNNGGGQMVIRPSNRPSMSSQRPSMPIPSQNNGGQMVNRPSNRPTMSAPRAPMAMPNTMTRPSRPSSNTPTLRVPGRPMSSSPFAQ